MSRSILSRIAARLKSGGRAPDSSLLLAPRYPQYAIGRGSYGGLTVLSFGEPTTLSIGNYCSFAAETQVFLGGEHRPDWVTTYPFNAIDPRFRDIPGHPKSKGDVTIGNDVWVARGATIMSGVTIGDGAVIGARAVVGRDVAPYAIVAGNPAVQIRYRFADDIIARLVEIRWWDWPEDRVLRAVPTLLDTDIEAFIKMVDSGAL